MRIGEEARVTFVDSRRVEVVDVSTKVYELYRQIRAQMPPMRWDHRILLWRDIVHAFGMKEGVCTFGDGEN